MVISAERAAAETIHGCGGFVEASSDLAKARKSTDPKPDYLHITVELQIIDGLVKDRVQCVPNGYYFLPIYDKEFSLSGKVIGVVGDPSYSAHAVDGLQDVKVSIKRVSNPQDSYSSISVLTFPKSGFKFDNVIPGVYELQAEYPMLVVHSSNESYVELDYGDLDICDIFTVPGYIVEGSVVSQGNPVLAVHIYLFPDDVTEVPCIQETSTSPFCHVVSDANGKFLFSTVPSSFIFIWLL